MSNVYDEESQQIEDLNVEADRVIAMNPSGVIENFESNGKKISCDGDKCVILGNDEVCENGICENKVVTSYTTYIIYFITMTNIIINITIFIIFFIFCN